jgi:HD-like signal output (HDOD) protein
MEDNTTAPAPDSLPVQHWSEIPESDRDFWEGLVGQLTLPPLMTEGDLLNLSSSDCEPAEAVERLRADPLVCAKILAVANSAAMGQARQVTSLERAIVLLGYNLVQAIVTIYYMEYTLREWPGYSLAHFDFVRRWSAGASVLAHNFARAARLEDPGALSTATLLARLGSLLLGMSPKPPDSSYHAMPNEISRLRLEQATWNITSPVLSGRLARLWGLADSTAELVERSWEPLFVELPDTADAKESLLVGAAIVLAAGYLSGPRFEARVVIGRYNNERLKANLDRHGLSDLLVQTCANPRVVKELKAITS